MVKRKSTSVKRKSTSVKRKSTSVKKPYVDNRIHTKFSRMSLIQKLKFIKENPKYHKYAAIGALSGGLISLAGLAVVNKGLNMIEKEKKEKENERLRIKYGKAF